MDKPIFIPMLYLCYTHSIVFSLSHSPNVLNLKFAQKRKFLIYCIFSASMFYKLLRILVLFGLQMPLPCHCHLQKWHSLIARITENVLQAPSSAFVKTRPHSSTKQWHRNQMISFLLGSGWKVGKSEQEYSGRYLCWYCRTKNLVGVRRHWTYMLMSRMGLRRC